MNKLLLWGVLLLCGCSSSPPQIKTYLLYDGYLNRDSLAMSSEPVVLMPIQLADYLKQDALVMRTNTQQLSVSRLHLWGQSLHQSIEQLVIDKVNSEANQRLLVSYQSPAAEKIDTKLFVEILHLLPDAQGNVLLQAQYWLTKSDQLLATHSFRQLVPLNGKGYESAVVTMGAVLDEWAEQINLSARAQNDLD